MPANPFDLTDNDAYFAWKQAKLEEYPASIEDLMVTIRDPAHLSVDEIAAIRRLGGRTNIVIYQLENPDFAEKSLVHDIGRQLGLQHLDDNLRADEDSVTSLQVREQQGNQYIPYTNRPLSWHSDGYYNAPGKQIRAIIMHCVSPSAEGGMNALLDHEIMYIRLRDENPTWVEALMQAEAMTIPPNIEEGKEIRGACTGPVFSVDEESGRLHMRYSARKRNIEWQQDDVTLSAAARISEILNEDSRVFKHQLTAGQGVICNNVLHNRTGFNDSSDQQRLVYRARYYDRIASTGLDAMSIEG